MFFKNKAIFSILSLLLLSSCVIFDSDSEVLPSRTIARNADVLDVVLVNKSHYSVVLVSDVSLALDKEKKLTYNYIQTDQQSFMNLHTKELTEPALTYHNLQSIFVFSDNDCLKNFQLKPATISLFLKENLLN